VLSTGNVIDSTTVYHLCSLCCYLDFAIIRLLAGPKQLMQNDNNRTNKQEKHFYSKCASFTTQTQSILPSLIKHVYTSGVDPRGGEGRGAITPPNKNIGARVSFCPSKILAWHCWPRKVTPKKQKNVDLHVKFQKLFRCPKLGCPKLSISFPSAPQHSRTLCLIRSLQTLHCSPPPINKIGLAPLL